MNVRIVLNELTDLRVELVARGHEPLRRKPFASGRRGCKEQSLDDECEDSQAIQAAGGGMTRNERFDSPRVVTHRLVNASIPPAAAITMGTRMMLPIRKIPN